MPTFLAPSSPALSTEGPKGSEYKSIALQLLLLHRIFTILFFSTTREIIGVWNNSSEQISQFNYTSTCKEGVAFFNPWTNTGCQWCHADQECLYLAQAPTWRWWSRLPEAAVEALPLTSLIESRSTIARSCRVFGRLWVMLALSILQHDGKHDRWREATAWGTRSTTEAKRCLHPFFPEEEGGNFGNCLLVWTCSL